MIWIKMLKSIDIPVGLNYRKYSKVCPQRVLIANLYHIAINNTNQEESFEIDI